SPSRAASSAGTRYARDLPVPVPACTSRCSPVATASATAAAIRCWPGRATPPGTAATAAASSDGTVGRPASAADRAPVESLLAEGLPAGFLLAGCAPAGRWPAAAAGAAVTPATVPRPPGRTPVGRAGAT